jgi:phage repressor protein C with HTH and peptisase S24 domain
MFFSLFKTSGHSMFPAIKDSSFFIASSLPFIYRDPKIGDMILFEVDNKIIVKKVIKVENDLIFIEGDNKMDSKKFNPIKKNEIIGKVIWIL